MIDYRLYLSIDYHPLKFSRPIKLNLQNCKLSILHSLERERVKRPIHINLSVHPFRSTVCLDVRHSFEKQFFCSLKLKLSFIHFVNRYIFWIIRLSVCPSLFCQSSIKISTESLSLCLTSCLQRRLHYHAVKTEGQSSIIIHSSFFLNMREHLYNWALPSFSLTLSHPTSVCPSHLQHGPHF